MSYNRMASKQIKFLPSMGQLVQQFTEQSGTSLSGGARTQAKMESAAPGMGMSGQSMGMGATPEGILMEHVAAPAADKVEKKSGLSKAEIAEAGELPSYMGGIARRSLEDQQEKEEEQENQGPSLGAGVGAGDALFGF